MNIEIIETSSKGLTGNLSPHHTSPITVAMPATDLTQAINAARRMIHHAGIPLRMIIIHDFTGQGFIKTINQTSNLLKPEYLAYVAQDALAGKNWLKNAYEAMNQANKSVCAFNEGRFLGNLAQFGLIKTTFTAKHYGQHNIFHQSYIKHRADDELTLLAKHHNQFIFAETAILMEVDYSLQKTTYPPDVKQYNTRIKALKIDPNP